MITHSDWLKSNSSEGSGPVLKKNKNCDQENWKGS